MRWPCRSSLTLTSVWLPTYCDTTGPSRSVSCVGWRSLLRTSPHTSVESTDGSVIVGPAMRPTSGSRMLILRRVPRTRSAFETAVAIPQRLPLIEPHLKPGSCATLSKLRPRMPPRRKSRAIRRGVNVIAIRILRRPAVTKLSIPKSGLSASSGDALERWRQGLL